jgi:hypothetical protein
LGLAGENALLTGCAKTLGIVDFANPPPDRDRVVSMSRENADIVRRCYDLFSQGDPEGMLA